MVVTSKLLISVKYSTEDGYHIYVMKNICFTLWFYVTYRPYFGKYYFILGVLTPFHANIFVKHNNIL